MFLKEFAKQANIQSDTTLHTIQISDVLACTSAEHAALLASIAATAHAGRSRR